MDTAEDLQVLHALPGRVRVHLPGWPGKGRRQVEKRLRAVRGVKRVEANPVTRNVLVCFDPRVADGDGLLGVLRESAREAAKLDREEEPHPPALREKQPGTLGRARVAVRGLDRDPHLGRHVVQRLESFPGVRARANPLTGRASYPPSRSPVGRAPRAHHPSPC